MREFFGGMATLAVVAGVAEWSTTAACYIAGMVALGLVAYKFARRG